MRFKIDENLPAEAADLFQGVGYDAITVRRQGLGGAVDRQVLLVCQQEDRILVTLDTGFADIRAYPPEQLPGLVVLRLKHQDKPLVLRTLARLIQLLPSEALPGHLWIVDEERVRVR